MNKSECYKGFQNGRKSVHLFTKEISEVQAQTQTKALKSLEDEALDTEHYQPRSQGCSGTIYNTPAPRTADDNSWRL